MTDSAPLPFKCDGCDQTDTDPMIHVGYVRWDKDDRTSILEPSFHYDCLPKDMIPVWFGDDFEAPQHANTRTAIELAESGVRGDALREALLELPSDNDLPVETQEG